MATLTTVMRVQKVSFFCDALFAPRVFIIPVMATAGYEPLVTIAAFCGLSIVYHLVTFAIGLFTTIRYDQGLPSAVAPVGRPLANPTGF